MEKTHSRAVDAIQPFLHLATSTASPTPRFTANLITNATSAPNTFVFAELLDTPAVQSLRSPDVPEQYRASLTLLEIFAWGTLEEYYGESTSSTREKETDIYTIHLPETRANLI